jgi:hypothetical protein
VLRFANRDDDWKPRSFADKEQVLATADLEHVAIPVAEASRGRQVGRSFGPFQPREKLLCAAKNDHRIDSVIHNRMRGTFARKSNADVRRHSAPTRAGPTDNDSGA